MRGNDASALWIGPSQSDLSPVFNFACGVSRPWIAAACFTSPALPPPAPFPSLFCMTDLQTDLQIDRQADKPADFLLPAVQLSLVLTKQMNEIEIALPRSPQPAPSVQLHVCCSPLRLPLRLMHARDNAAWAIARSLCYSRHSSKRRLCARPRVTATSKANRPLPVASPRSVAGHPSHWAPLDHPVAPSPPLPAQAVPLTPTCDPSFPQACCGATETMENYTLARGWHNIRWRWGRCQCTMPHWCCRCLECR